MAQNEVFWKLHEGLPRQGPGSEETSNILFAAAAQARLIETAIDMGCGTGAGTLYLAQKNIQVIAVDTNATYLSKVNSEAKEKGLDSYVKTLETSMDQAHVTDPVDLIWAEGSMYIIGWKHALTLWKELLKPGGVIVATDCFWFTDTPSPEAWKFWQADPNMVNLEKATRLIQECGYEIISQYIQPDSDWFDSYYNPLQANVNNNRSSVDQEMIGAVRAAQEEIDVRRSFGDEYEHVGFVLRKT